jgi:hypothetical protein
VYKKIRTLAAKIETTPGTLETLTATEGTYRAYNVMLQPLPTPEKREAYRQFGNIASIPTGMLGVATFRTDLTHDGTTVPDWATLLPACGYVNAAGVFTPRTEPPGSNVKTITIGMWSGSNASGAAQYRRIAGASGTFTINFPSSRSAYIDWTFTGIWQAPTNASIITPTYSTAPVLVAKGMTTSFNSVTFCAEMITFNAGNTVEPIFCQDSAIGYKFVAISNREPMITANPETVINSTQDRYAPLLTPTEQVLSIAIGSAITINAPKAQIVNNQEGDRTGLVIDQLDFQLNQNANAVDEDVSLTFS